MSTVDSAFVNLTNRQLKFLTQLVDADERTGGSEFIFLEVKLRCSLTYSASIRYWAEGDLSDLGQLQAERLVNYRYLTAGQYRGKPTQRGIEAVRLLKNQLHGETEVASPSERSKQPSSPQDETVEERSVRRRLIVDPLMKHAGIKSDDEWAERAGGAMDRNTPRDYRNGKTKRLRDSTRDALAAALRVDGSKLPA